jgi:pyruvate, water dikinase
VEEFVWCCDRISTAGLFAFTSFEVWIMAEVPSVLFLLEDYVKAGVQGIAIGSNDLTQLILGVDRDQPLLDDALNASHPAVMAAMSQMIQRAHTLQIPCSLCGQVQHQLIHKLVEWGITAISVEMQAVSQTRQAIAKAEQKLLFERLQEIGP